MISGFNWWIFVSLGLLNKMLMWLCLFIVKNIIWSELSFLKMILCEWRFGCWKLRRFMVLLNLLLVSSVMVLLVLLNCSLRLILYGLVIKVIKIIWLSCFIRLVLCVNFFLKFCFYLGYGVCYKKFCVKEWSWLY